MQLELLLKSVNSLSDEKELLLGNHHLEMTAMIEEAKARQKRLTQLERKHQDLSLVKTETTSVSSESDQHFESRMRLAISRKDHEIRELRDDHERQMAILRTPLDKRDDTPTPVVTDEKVVSVIATLSGTLHTLEATVRALPKKGALVPLDVTSALSVAIPAELDLGDSWKPAAIEKERHLLRSPVLALLSIGLFNKIKEAQRRATEASTKNTDADPSDFADGGD